MNEPVGAVAEKMPAGISLPGKEWKMSLPDAVSAGLKPEEFQVDANLLRNTIHVVMQAKGGSGKTFVSSLLASFFQRHVKGLPLRCYDLDSTNTHSFSAFKALGVERLSDVDMSTLDVDSTKFDTAFGQVLDPNGEDGIIVIDTGASSYASVIRYLLDTDYPSLAALADRPWRFIIHIVVTASDMKDCEESLDYIHRKIDNPFVEFVMWGNEYFGHLDEFYARNMERYSRLFNDKNLLLPPVDPKNMGVHLARMRTEGLTATQIMEVKGMNPMVGARIRQYFYGHAGGKGGVFKQLRDIDWSPKKLELE